MSTPVSLIPVEVVQAPEDPSHASCAICNGRPSMKAYRPHSLDGGCWCTRNSGTGARIRDTCFIAALYLP